VEGNTFDNISTNAPFAIRNAQYKLMHTYKGNDQSIWYTTYETVDNDDELSKISSCSQSNAIKGTFTKFLFDLVNDPYEENNLYDEDGYDDIKDELLSQLDLGKVKPELYYYSASSAKAFWNKNDYFVQPWNFTKSIERSSRATSEPSRCTYSGLLSPKY